MKKMTFKKSAASLAVAAALGAVGTSVQAVNMTNDGIGQVVLFPFYTVNNSYDNYLNVTNTSDDVVVFKVRFRESYNSQDVRDFNVILSPYDVWTGTVTLATDGVRAVVTTRDTSCTSPTLFDLGDGLRGVDFTNIAYANANAGTQDNGPAGVSRTREGYYEVISMGIVPSHQENDGSWTAENNPNGQAILDASLHKGGTGNNTQVPSNCKFFTPWDQNFMKIGLEQPENNLKANATLINVENGFAAGIDPTILANFVIEGDDIANEPFDDLPNYGDATPISVVGIDDPAAAGVLATLNGFPGESIATDWSAGGQRLGGLNAVTAVLQRSSVVNEYVAREGAAASEWVVTFPTKRYYTNDNAGIVVNSPVDPFNEEFGALLAGTSCDDVVYTLTDREEFRFTPTIDPENPPFSPPPPPDIIQEGRLALCYEVNTLAFGDGGVAAGDDLFGSPTVLGVDISQTGSTGWMDLTLEYVIDSSPVYTFTDDAIGMVAADGTNFNGLPAIGFVAKGVLNGVVDTNLRTYMMTWEHGYRRNIFSGQRP